MAIPPAQLLLIPICPWGNVTSGNGLSISGMLSLQCPTFLLYNLFLCLHRHSISGEAGGEPGICCLTQVLVAAPDTKWLILHSRVPTMPCPRHAFLPPWWVLSADPSSSGQQLEQRAPWGVQQSPKTLLRTILFLAPEHIQAARAAVENQRHTWYWPATAEGMLVWAAQKLPETVQFLTHRYSPSHEKTVSGRPTKPQRNPKSTLLGPSFPKICSVTTSKLCQISHLAGIKNTH